MLLGILAGLLAVAIWIVRKRFSTKHLPFPPGPKTLPVIGNLLQMPPVKPWETYRKWSEDLGSGIIYLQLPLQSILVLGSVESAFDLLERRSHIYSDRSPSTMHKLLGWDFNFGLSGYGPSWRAHRRSFHQYFNQNAILEYRGGQLETARRFLTWVLETPQDTYQSVRRFNTSVIFRAVYGMRITGLNDLYVRLVQKAVEGISVVTIPGTHWVEFFPFLHKIPGTRSWRLKEEYRPAVDGMRNKPYDAVKQAVSDGTAIPSIIHSMIANMQNRGDSMTPAELEEAENMARNIGGVAYAGASDTTTVTLQSWFLAMALYPEAQKKAQAELDRVVGPDRLPEFEDLESLVYIKAMVMETLRWLPAAPFGVPHRLMEDDVYKGYFIPKGTVVIANAAYLLHNPEHYPEPEKFNPDRFIGPDGTINHDVLDPAKLAFGFGRRICPGQPFAENNMSMFISSVLHVFDITPGLDDNGNPMILTDEWKSGLLSGPVDFPRGVKPRSAKAERLIREVMAEESLSN